MAANVSGGSLQSGAQTEKTDRLREVRTAKMGAFPAKQPGND